MQFHTIFDHYWKLLSNQRLLRIENRRWFATAWLIVTTIFLGLALMAMHVRNSDQVKAAHTAENFIIALQADNAGDAYDLGSTTFRQATTEDNLRLIFDQIGPYARQAQVELVDSHIPANTNDGARIGYTYRAAKTKTITYIRIVTVKQAGEWRVYSLHTSDKPLLAK